MLFRSGQQHDNLLPASLAHVHEFAQSNACIDQEHSIIPSRFLPASVFTCYYTARTEYKKSLKSQWGRLAKEANGRVKHRVCGQAHWESK